MKNRWDKVDERALQVIKHCVNVTLLQLWLPQLLTKWVYPRSWGAYILIRDMVCYYAPRKDREFSWTSEEEDGWKDQGNTTVRQVRHQALIDGQQSNRRQKVTVGRQSSRAARSVHKQEPGSPELVEGERGRWVQRAESGSHNVQNFFKTDQLYIYSSYSLSTSKTHWKTP